MQGKIQQQYYTRGRKGIFRSNEGLDTVAKSPSLDNNFIKKTLHPFCLYHAPQELRQRGEQDLAKYPESLTVFTAETGELVIGRGVFAGADFTGQRDTIFVHQYVVPVDRKEQAYRTPDSIFRIRFFESKYNEEQTSLPELDELDYTPGPKLEEERETLKRLGIGEMRFKQLLWAIMMSVSSNKKVYVALDVDVSESSLYANRLLGLLYRCLPYGMRRKFGFTTYSHEPQGKKFINAMFVEKGSIRAGDRNIDKDYIFDFPNERFSNVEPQGSDPYYLDFAWANRERPEELAAFYEFAEEALQDMDASMQSSLPAYYQLCALYLVEQGDDSLYEANKEASVSGTLSYLNKDNVERKPRMDGLFWKLVDKEVSLLGTGYTPTFGFLEAMIDFYRIGGMKEKLVTSLIRFLYNGWNYHEDSRLAQQVFQAMVKHEELFQSVVRRMLHTDQFAPVVHGYLLDRLQPISKMSALLDELSFWLKQNEEALCTPYFREQLIRVTKELLDKDKERIAAGGSLNAFLDKQYKSKSDNAKRLQEFYNDLDLQAQKTIIAHADLERITMQQLEGVKYMLGHHSQVLSDSLGPKDQAVFNILQCASFLLRNANMKEAENYMTLSLLQPREIDQLQSLLQRLLKDKVRSDSYEKIAYAFYESGTEPGECSFSYLKMLDYVLKQSNHSDEMYDFLNWSASYPYFLDARGKIAREYEGAIRGYFNKTDRGALNKRNVWLKLKGTPNRSFKKLYDDIRLAQSNPIIRFIKKNRKMLIQFGGIVVGVAALTIGGIYAFQSWSGPSEPVQQEPKTEDNAGKQQPAAPADKSGQPGGQTGTQGGQSGTQSGQTGTSGANTGSGTSTSGGGQTTGQTTNSPASSSTPSGTSQTGAGGARP
ncbi:hypothetical protein FE783_28165 [Paenibacillus mesophilus]|uniref:GAP1-N2 domain-containing protein n=1 Tax=Paenibacillus mesophilus TaxID=2582849 RepID=UPI00110E71F6|nr:hypothetical protein [Paenibacillus mesophilus]TMV45807.1 hypothetical protein FE783_28165 [Paenibacillus mesophilus]